MAKASGDHRMIAAYRNKEDLHKLTASFIFEKSIENISEKERNLGKIVNFGLIYGMGVAKFCLTTAQKHNIYLTKTQASQFRKKFFLLCKGVAAYHQRICREWRSGTRVSYSLDGGLKCGVSVPNRHLMNYSIIPSRGQMPLLLNGRSLCSILAYCRRFTTSKVDFNRT